MNNPQASLVTLHHVGIWVAPDALPAVLAFFDDYLQYAQVSRVERKGGGERLLLRNCVSQTIEILTAPDVQTLASYPRHPRDRVAGVAHLCFDVPDVRALKQRFDEAGVEVIMQAPKDDGYVTSELGVHRILFVQAPGNITIELFEFKTRSAL